MQAKWTNLFIQILMIILQTLRSFVIILHIADTKQTENCNGKELLLLQEFFHFGQFLRLDCEERHYHKAMVATSSFVHSAPIPKLVGRLILEQAGMIRFQSVEDDKGRERMLSSHPE